LKQTLYLCHQLYNSALEQRIRAYNQNKKSLGYYDQQNELPAFKKEFPECKSVLDRDLNASVNILQVGRGATKFTLGEICQWTGQ